MCGITGTSEWAGEDSTDEPLTDLFVETFSWQLAPSEYDPKLTVLELQRTDGAQATFVPI